MRRLKILALFGLVLLLAAATSEAALQPNRPRVKRLDHFWCYFIPESEPPRVGQVWLQDQFDIATGAFQPVQVGQPRWFCNPVVKRHNNRVTQINDKNAHLKFYEIAVGSDIPAPPRLVVYSNQFQRKSVAVLGQPRMLAVPTQKVEPGNHDFPRRLDHFKCYDVEQGKPANAVAGLRDQFSAAASSVDVGGLAFFCNPTRKIRLDDAGNVNEVTGVKNARDHLACYRAPGPALEPITVVARNQFGEEVLVLERAELLCVPTVKHHLGEIDSLTDILPGDD
jgi:hypothetical protein